MTKEKAFINEVYSPSKQQSAPVLLKFQNGDLITSHKDNSLYFPMKYDNDKQKRAVVIASENVYSGIVGGSTDSKLTDTYICVRNKKTNKVRILPLDHVKLINHVYQEKEKTKFATLTKENSFALVMRNFGGRKDIRYLNNQERNKVSIDVVKDQLENTVEESTVLDTSEPIVSAEDSVERVRPPFNKEATSLDNIFNIYDVIPLELMDRLDEEASLLHATEVDDIPISSDYLKDVMKSLKKTTQSGQTLLKLKIIIYMDALQTLVKTKGNVLTKKELSKVTEKVENDVRARFSEMGTKNMLRTSYTNEKALCYYLVLAFMISEKYELDLNILSQELCMPKTKILKFAHLVNATQKTRSNALGLRLPSNMKPANLSFVSKRKK